MTSGSRHRLAVSWSTCRAVAAGECWSPVRRAGSVWRSHARSRAAERASCSAPGARRCSTRSRPRSAGAPSGATSPGARTSSDFSPRPATSTCWSRTPRCRRRASSPSSSQEQIDRMLEINLRAPIALARAIAPGMIERGSGHLVFISSLAGKAAAPASSIYSATKFGLRGFALGLREDLRHAGRRRVGGAPGVHQRRRDVRRRERRAAPRRRDADAPSRSPTAVIRAVERDRAEIEVAPLRAAARRELRERRSRPWPRACSRRIGGDKVATEIAAGQTDKR